jgi:hypothetical protein
MAESWGSAEMFFSFKDRNRNVHDLNTKLQAQQKLIFYMFGAVRAFEMELKLHEKQMENVNLCHFSSYDLSHKNGRVSVPLPSVCSLAETI